MVLLPRFRNGVHSAGLFTRTKQKAIWAFLLGFSILFSSCLTPGDLKKKVKTGMDTSSGTLVSPVPVSACDSSDATSSPTPSTLSDAGDGSAIFVGHRLLFAGSEEFPGTGNVDILNLTTHVWTKSNLSVPRARMSTATINGKAYFMGGITGSSLSSAAASTAIDIYDSLTDSWTTDHLATARIGAQAVSVGGVLVITGGSTSNGNPLGTLEVIDTGTNTRRTVSLATARHAHAAVSVDTKVYIIGGYSCPLNATTPSCAINSIEIYDVALSQFLAPIQMPFQRGRLAAVALNSKLYLYGGDNLSPPTGQGIFSFSTLDVFDVQAATWSKIFLPWTVGTGSASGVSWNYVVFAGGSLSQNQITLVDSLTGAVTFKTLAQGRYNLAAASSGDAIYFGGGTGSGGDKFSTIEVLNPTLSQLAYLSPPTLTCGKGASTMEQTPFQLSDPNDDTVIAVGSKILFAGSRLSDVRQGMVDIYDLPTRIWAKKKLSIPRYNSGAAVVGGKAYLVGGSKDPVSAPVDAMDIYNSESDNWSTDHLSVARTGAEVAVVGQLLLVTGGVGTNTTTPILATMEIINTQSNSRQTVSLSTGRNHHTAVGVGTKAYIMGGYNCPLWNDSCSLTTMDVYDSATGQTTVLQMPLKRAGHVAAVFGSKIYLAGGHRFASTGVGQPFSTVDIFDTQTSLWTSMPLPSPPGHGAVASVSGNYVVFAGGLLSPNQVILIDTTSGKITTRSLAQGRSFFGAAAARSAVKNTIYFGGGTSDAAGSGGIFSVEVLDPDSGDLSSLMPF